MINKESDKRFEELLNAAGRAAEEFKSIDSKETIRLISHLDCDGISAAAIVIKMLNRLNRKYTVSIVQQLEDKDIMEIAKETYSTIFFTDIGSGQLPSIRKYLNKKRVFVLDHHEIAGKDDLSVYNNLVHLNPHLFGIDGSTEISGAGIVLLFAMAVDLKNEEMAHIALLGAIGDVQENPHFSEINQKIVGWAEHSGKITVEKGLRCFGIQTKPVYKLLEQSTDFFIPGVSGSESGAVQFLQHLGINPRCGDGSWKKMCDLSQSETQKLIEGIVVMRIGEKDPENIIGCIYTLVNEKTESPLRDAKEFSTLLNACGRMGKASFGIGACLGDSRAKQMALSTLADYKKEIMKSLRWYDENSESVIKGNGFVIINAKDKVISTLIGTVASILSKSQVFPENTIILSMAQEFNGKTKVSLRISGQKKSEMDMREIAKKITEVSGGEAGGHRNAAGAVILTESEDKFIENAKIILEKAALEEKIL